MLVVARTVNRLGAFSLPFLSLQLSRELGASLSTIGLLLTGFGAATMVSRLFGGWLADSWGRRRTMIGGLLGCAVAQLAIAGSRSLAAAGVAVVLLGLAYEVYEAPSQALIADSVDQHARAAAFGLLGASLSVAALGAGVVATVVAPVSLRLLFVADAASCLLAVLVILRWLPRDPARRPIHGRAADAAPPLTSPAVAPAGAERAACSDRAPSSLLVFLFATNTVFAVCYLQAGMLLPLTMARRDVAAFGYGVVVVTASCVVLASQPLLRRRRRRAGRTSSSLIGPHAGPIAGGHLLLAASLAGYGVARTLTGFVLATVVGGIGEVLLAGHVLALVSAIAPATRRGRYLAGFGLSWGVAGTAGPIPATFLLRHGGDQVLWSVCAAGCASVAVAYGLLIVRRTRSSATAWVGSPR